MAGLTNFSLVHGVAVLRMRFLEVSPTLPLLFELKARPRDFTPCVCVGLIHKTETVPLSHPPSSFPSRSGVEPLPPLIREQ